MSFFGKEYKLEKDVNFDGFLRSVGLPEDKVQAQLAFKPSQKLVQNGDSYTLTAATPQGPKVVTFKSGVAFDDTIGDGVVVKSTYTVDGNTVTHTVSGDNGVVTFKKEFNGDQLVVTITTDKWDGVARRYYKA